MPTETENIKDKPELPSPGYEDCIGMVVVEIDLVNLLAECGLATSKSEAKRMMDQGGVRIEGEKCTDRVIWFSGFDFIIKYGKRNFKRIIINSMRQFNDPELWEEVYES